MSIEALDFITIAKEHALKTVSHISNASVEMKDFDIQEEEKLAELKDKLQTHSITQGEYDAQRKDLIEKKKAIVEKWRSIMQDGEEKLFDEMLPKFESILTADEDDCTLPLSNDRMLTIPADYTPKEINAINKLLKDLQEAQTDDMKAVECITKARDKCIELKLKIILNGENLDKFADIDIQNTKYKKLPLVIALLPQIIHAMHYVCKYNEKQLLKKK